MRAAASPQILLKGIGIQALKVKLFRLPEGISADRADEFNDFEVLEEREDSTSYLGTPIFDPFKFQGGQFIEFGLTGPPQPFDELIIPSAIIEVSQSKNIITTAIQGRNGTVKEFVSDGDFSITLTGVIVGKNEGGKVKGIGNVYPFDDVQKLITICKIPAPISVTSSFLDKIFSISQVVITDYSIPQKEASRNMQPFQISMLSDVPIELEELAVTKFSKTIIVPGPIIIVT